MDTSKKRKATDEAVPTGGIPAGGAEEDESSFSDSSSEDSEDDISLVAKKGKQRAKDGGPQGDTRDRGEGEEEDNDDEEEGGWGGDGNYGMQNVTFDFCDPKESQFHAVRRLLQRYVQLKEGFRCSELADIVVGQPQVGTMVEQDGEDGDVFAFATAVSLHAYADKECIQQVRKFILDHAPAAHKSELTKLLSQASKPLALLLAERMVNLPEAVVPALHDCLVKDLQWVAGSTDADSFHEVDRASLRFQNFIMITRRFRVPVRKSKKAKRSKKRAKNAGAGSGGGTDDDTPSWTYSRFEDEIFVKNAEFSFSFGCSTPDQHAGRVYEHVIAVFNLQQLQRTAADIAQLVADGSDADD